MFYRLRISPEPEVSLVGHIRYRAGWSDSYRHRENILLYIRSGSFRYDFEDGRSYSVSGGGCHMIPAGSAYRVTVTDDCEFSYIHFALASPAEAAGEDEVAEEMTRLKKSQLASRLARNWPDPRPDTLFVPALIDTGEDEEKIRYRFARIDETRNGTYELDRFRTANVFMGLLISLSAAGAARLSGFSEYPAALIRMTAYVRDNISGELSLSALSERFGYSKQYIMRLFRTHLGTTVSEYVNSVRMRRALDLLRSTGMSVGEVAYSLGYSSGYYFSRVFRATFSMSPSEYVKKGGVL